MLYRLEMTALPEAAREGYMSAASIKRVAWQHVLASLRRKRAAIAALVAAAAAALAHRHRRQCHVKSALQILSLAK